MDTEYKRCLRQNVWKIDIISLKKEKYGHPDKVWTVFKFKSWAIQIIKLYKPYVARIVSRIIRKANKKLKGNEYG